MVGSRVLVLSKAQCLCQHALTELVRLVLGQGFEVVPDLGACPSGFGKCQPGGIGLGIVARDHFDHIAVVQLGAQRAFFAVDAGRHGPVADVAVDRVGEIDHGGAARQRQNFAARCENVDRIGKQIDLDVVPEFDRIVCFLLYKNQ